jgi:hypothetical protein
MKKTLILLFAALLVVAFTVPASAFDSVFGGYNRVRYYIQTDFDGAKDSGAANVNQWDTRTRLFYTAVFSDDFKFVNAFEFNVTFGDIAGGGSIGTDGTGIFRIKHSYTDFRTGAFRWTLGLQPATLARGFLFADDFAGLIARYQPGTTGDLLVPVMFAKVSEGGTGTPNDDTTLVAVYPFFPIGSIMVNPYLLYEWNNLGADNDQYWLGVDLDFKIQNFGLWVTGIYNFGDEDPDTSISAYLAGLGFNVPIGGFGINGEIWYATGDDDAADDKQKAFQPPPGSSYYWSEIMGLGIFDNQASFGSPDDNITNILAANIGVDFKFSDQFGLAADLWYAQLNEDDANGNTDLGTEIDIVLSYMLIENLKLEVVGAYLFAGDASNEFAGAGADTADPYEFGLRTSFSF